MSELRVFLAGEGSNELGSRVGPRAYQTDDAPGVIATLLRRARAEGWVVGGARGWNSNGKRSFVARPNASFARGIGRARFEREDTRIVLVVANDAIEAGCTVLAFLRDADKDEGREQAVQEGVEKIAEMFDARLETVGAVVVPKLEAWVLAALGNGGTEGLTPAATDRALAEKGVPAKSTAAFVEIFERANLEDLPRDATRLRAWLARAAVVLGTSAE